jgi:diadenylate cyclase
LNALPAEEILDLHRIAEILGYSSENSGIDQGVVPRGYRMLNRVPRLPESIVNKLVERFGSFPKLLAASLEELDDVEGIGATRARAIQDHLARLADSSGFDRYT